MCRTYQRVWKKLSNKKKVVIVVGSEGALVIGGPKDASAK
jgi:hypothetical protein